jgi:AcrR family transcriptional regulator
VTTPVRLPAAERRQAIIEAAVEVFAAGSYRGVTTAEIARAAGVSEPILYRHFGSKRELYLAAVEHVWADVRRRWEEIAASTGDPSEWLRRIAQAKSSLTSSKFVLGDLWAQALSEAGEDPELRKFLRTHLREVHEFLAAQLARAQEMGVVVAERDPAAEAWIFLAGGILSTIGRRIGLLHEQDFARVRAARVEWLTGRKQEG